MAGQGGSVSAGQEAEALVQALVEVCERHGGQAGRRQLDGEGDAVDPPTDRRHQRPQGVGEGEFAVVVAGPFDEQLDCLARFQILRRGHLVGRATEGPHPVDPLAVDAEGLARGGEQVDPRAAAMDQVGQLGAGVHHVLAVVEDDENVLRPEHFHQRVCTDAVHLCADSQCLLDGARHVSWVVDRSQVDEPDALAGPVEQFSRHLEGKARLARSTGPRHRDQAVVAHQRAHLGQLDGAADEAARILGQIVRKLGVVQRAQRRERGLEALGTELEDLFGAAQVLQAVAAQITQRHSLGQDLFHQ